MLAESILAVVILVVYCLWQLRPKSSYVCRPYNVSREPLLEEVDFVVVGAGPGGLAATQCLLEREKDKSVLLIERGYDPSSAGLFASFTGFAKKSNLLLFSGDLLGSMYDDGWQVHRPLQRKADGGGDDTSLVAPYARGRAVGGTSFLDWALYFPSIGVRVGAKLVEEPVVPHSFPLNRNPLSWSFAESAGSVLKKRHFACMDEPHARNSVFPGLLRLDEDGCRLSLSHYLLRGRSSRLTVLEGCKVIGLSFNDEGTVTCVRCKLANSRIVEVNVRRGVVLSAGVVGTACLLRNVLPTPQTSYTARDSIALPLIFRARPGISDDRRNVCSFKTRVAWWAARRGPFLNSVCGTLATVDVPALGPRAELVIFFLPFGGRDPALYRRFGIDNVLSMFSEGFILLMVLRGVEETAFDFFMERAGDGGERQGNSHHRTRVISSDVSRMSEEVVQKVVDAFLEGMQFCRKIVTEPPLGHLSTGQEAMDVTLLADPKCAIEYTRLMRTPLIKLTPRQRASAPALIAWAKEASISPAYMAAYIRRHAVWLGFSSGSCATSLASDESFRVAGTRNVFLGDCSAVTETMLKNCGGDTLRAGSVSTAMTIGRAAAIELLSI